MADHTRHMVGVEDTGAESDKRWPNKVDLGGISKTDEKVGLPRKILADPRDCPIQPMG